MSDRHLRCATAYAAQGWRVFPLVPKTKRPITANGFHDATTDVEQIRQWWGREPEAGIGVATGEASGIWVLDIDGVVGGVNWWWWEAQHGAVHSLAQRTGREDGGRQLILRWPQGRVVRSRTGLLPGIDVRGEGGYVVVAPSIHPSGRRYRWEGRVAIAEAPEALLALVGARVPHDARQPMGHPGQGRSGSRLSDARQEGRTTPYGRRAADDLETELALTGRGGRDCEAYRVAVRLIELEEAGELAPGETEGVLRRALGQCGYLADPRRERGEAGLQRILRSARSRGGS